MQSPRTPPARRSRPRHPRAVPYPLSLALLGVAVRREARDAHDDTDTPEPGSLRSHSSVPQDSVPGQGAHAAAHQGQDSGPQHRARHDSGAATPNAEAVARAICLKLLTVAPRTRAQLAAALRSRAVPQGAVEEVLRGFADVGLIDDAMFASAWVESRHHSRGLSRRVLAAELRRRGVSEEDVQGAIGSLDAEREALTARQLVSKKLAATRGQPAPARARRLAAMLARKGYPPAMVFRVVREALEQEGVDATEAGLDESTEAWPSDPQDSEPDGSAQADLS